MNRATTAVCSMAIYRPSERTTDAQRDYKLKCAHPMWET